MSKTGDRLDRLEEMAAGTVVRYCTKCGHDTVQEIGLIYNARNTRGYVAQRLPSHGMFSGWVAVVARKCLNCGTIWEQKKIDMEFEKE